MGLNGSYQIVNGKVPRPWRDTRGVLISLSQAVEPVGA